MTERGTPVALIHPINGAVRAVTVEGKLASLAAQGAVSLPTRKPLARIRLVKVSGKPISKVIVDERR